MDKMTEMIRDLSDLPVQVLALLVCLGVLALAGYAIHAATKGGSK